MLFRSKHLRAPAAAPGQKVEEVIFADRAGAGWGIGFGFAIGNAADQVVHALSLYTGGQYAGPLSEFSRPLRPQLLKVSSALDLSGSMR